MQARGNTKSILQKVSEIQNLIGQANAAYLNDVSGCRADKVKDALKKAHELCTEITSMYDPI